jgi:DNA-binding NarL/FixJ family response regulator
MIGRPVRCRTFIGRRTELATLNEARKSLVKSAGSFVLVSGEAGIGKTRLLAEFLDHARNRREIAIVKTECLLGAQAPLGPVRALLGELIGVVPIAELPRKIWHALAQVIPDRLPRDSVAANSDVVLEKDQLFATLLAFLRIVCSKRATVLSVEDVHWSDESTVQFLGYVAQRQEQMRLLVVATYRNDEIESNSALLASMEPLLRAASSIGVALEPFGPGDVRAMIDGTLEGRRTIPDTVARDIERKSEGNPFFVEELVKDYIERDIAGRSTSQLPASIRATISHRLAELMPATRSVLDRAAVLGQRFDPAVLALVMECDAAAIAPALREARDHNLLVDSGTGRLSCRFRHALTRQTIYDNVPAFEARILHERILQTLEGTDSSAHVEELAYHAWEAGDVPRIVRYNERAGDTAFSMRALPEALMYFERALDKAAEPDDRARLFERIGALERLQGHYHRARDSFESAVAIRLELGHYDAAAMLAASVAGQRYNVGDQNAREYAERFLATHGAKMGPAARDFLLVVMARLASAFCDFQSAERLVNAVSDPEALAPTARQNYLIVRLMRSTYADDVKAWKRNAEQVDQLLPHLAPEALVSVESALALTGIFLGANEHIERALARADRVEREWGFRAHRLYATATRASYAYQRGRLAEASACVEEVAANLDVFPPRRIAGAVAAHLAIAFGDDALWKRFDAKILHEARERLEDPDCVYILGAHAAIAAADGDADEAQTDLRAALETLAYSSPEATHVLLNAARYLPLDELAGVESIAQASARSAGETSRANLALVRATIAARAGDSSASAAQGETAAQLYASLGWPLLEAEALVHAQRVEEALTIYERCGAAGMLRSLRSVSPPAALATLSLREREVADFVARGLRNAEIAKRLGIRLKTVEKHIASIFEKLEVHSRAKLAALVVSTEAS